MRSIEARVSSSEREDEGGSIEEENNPTRGGRQKRGTFIHPHLASPAAPETVCFLIARSANLPISFRKKEGKKVVSLYLLNLCRIWHFLLLRSRLTFAASNLSCMKKLFTALLLFLLWGVAQPLAAQLTLDSCQRLAEQHHPLAQRRALIVQTQALTLDNIARGWWPQIVASAQATLQSDVAQWPSSLAQLMQAAGAPLPQGMAKDQYKAMLQVEQAIYDGGASRAQAAVVRAETAVKEARNGVELYALRRRVSDLYFGILLIDRRVESQRSTLLLLQDNERKLSNLVARGLAIEADVATVQAERLSVEQQLASGVAQRRALVLMLATFIGRAPSTVEQLATPPDRLVPTAIEALRPELRLFAASEQWLNERERSLKVGLLPRVSAFAQGWYGYPGLNLFEDMYSRRWSLNGMIGLRATWSLSRLYSYRADRRLLHVARQDNELERQAFCLNLSLQSLQESEAIAQHRTLLAKDEEICALRRQVRLATERRLDSGVVDVNALMQDIHREAQAQAARDLHHIQLLQAQSHLSNTLNYE